MKILEKLKNIIKDIGKQLLVIFLYLLTIEILYLVFSKILKGNNLVLLNLTYILIYLILLIIFLILFRKIIVPDLAEFKKNGKKYLLTTYHYYLIGLAVMIISNLIIGKFIGLPSNEEANREMLTKLPYYSILSVVVFAPIIEELMTRVILKDTFKHKWIYIILSGLIFGAMHVIFSGNLKELFFIIPYGVLGCSLAKIYSKTNNIWSNITFHSLHNLITLLLIFIGV